MIREAYTYKTIVLNYTVIQVYKDKLVLNVKFPDPSKVSKSSEKDTIIV